MMKLQFRRATLDDIPQLLALAADARALFRQQGIDQWQDGYPDTGDFARDIEKGESWVLAEDETLRATAALCFGPQAEYAVIHEGRWRVEEPSAALHRLIVDGNSKRAGLASLLWQKCEEIARLNGVNGVRGDTHRDNAAMQAFLTRQGFERQGVIYLLDGAERIAFDKLF